ncbi:MAG: DUF4062 domain-containing protein [Cytophagaceae bacterium]|nr:DUF4062 domain-containing protein [Cytophagaceae bacterium]
MQFEYDIFISYSKKDNLPLPQNTNKGWVSSFHKFLETRLTQILGEKPRFLHYANEEKPVASELKKACVLISVVSPQYVRQSDSIEDIEVFYTEAEKNGTLKIGEKERIFKVVKFPVAVEQQPSRIRPLLGYDMFETDLITGDFKEINNFFLPEAEKNFWMKLDDLAHDIYDILKQVKIEREPKQKQEPDAVYLAETGYDLLLERDLIKRELQRHGYRVLPDHTLPSNVREMEAVIKRDLSECKLSIHLIGDSYGEVPEGPDKSIVDIQNQIAAEHCSYASAVPGERSFDFNRLIWVSPAVKLTDEKQKIFIENLKRDAEKLSGAEVVQTPLEDLKNIIRYELIDNADKPLTVADTASSTGLPIVYIVFDQSDMAAGNELMEIIKAKGNEVLIPVFKGDLLQVRNQHFDNLRKCDVAMIYYGRINQQWVQMKVLDLLKAPGLGRTKGELTKVIFTEKNHKLDAKKLGTQGISIIENKDGMHLSIEPFMAKINNKVR